MKNPDMRTFDFFNLRSSQGYSKVITKISGILYLHQEFIPCQGFLCFCSFIYQFDDCLVENTTEFGEVVPVNVFVDAPVGQIPIDC